MGANVAFTFEHKINVEYGKILMSYFIKLVCMLVVCVTWIDYKLLYMAKNYV